MTRAYLGILLLDAVYLGLGAAILQAAGIRAGTRVGRAGLALAVGWAAFAVLASLALMAGLPLAVWQVLLLAAIVAGCALAASRRWPVRSVLAPAVDDGARWQRYLGRGCAALLGVQLGLLVVRALYAHADTNYDSWAFWLSKAQSIYFFGGLDTGPGGFGSLDNPEYPPAAPALEAVTFRFAGGVVPTAIPLQHALVGVAFFLAAAALLARRVPRWILWPSLLALALAPNVTFYFDTALADLPVAYLVSLGAIAAALWLLEGSAGMLILCGIFVAAASLTKSEGFMLSAALVAALAAASLLTQRRRLPLLPLAATPVLALALWKLWLAANDQRLESVLYRTSDLLRPGFLFDRVDRFTYASRELLAILFEPGHWLLVAPLAIVVGGLALARRSALGVLYLGWLVLGFLGVTSVYWISNADVTWHVGTSANRVSASLMLFAGALLPLLVAELARDRGAQ